MKNRYKDKLLTALEKILIMFIFIKNFYKSMRNGN